MEAIVFWLVVINIFINAIVLNSQLKQLEKLRAFVTTASVYVNAYNLVAKKQQEYAEGFNAMKEVTDNQADLLEAILAYLGALPEAQERATLARKPRRAPKDSPKNSTATD